MNSPSNSLLIALISSLSFKIIHYWNLKGTLATTWIYFERRFWDIMPNNLKKNLGHKLYLHFKRQLSPRSALCYVASAATVLYTSWWWIPGGSTGSIKKTFKLSNETGIKIWSCFIHRLNSSAKPLLFLTKWSSN